jgi:hypothetical protein
MHDSQAVGAVSREAAEWYAIDCTTVRLELIFMSIGGPQAHAKLLPWNYFRFARRSSAD